MATKKVEKKGCACDLDKEITEFKRRQEIDAQEAFDERQKVNNTLFYILAGVCLQVVLSLVLLYYVTSCGASCTHP